MTRDHDGFEVQRKGFRRICSTTKVAWRRIRSPGSSPRLHGYPKGRAWSDFSPISIAEQKLADACRLGTECDLEGEAPPEEATLENTIRAEFLRFLALGGDKTAPVHEKGVRLRGAFIEEELEFKGCDLPFDLFLWACRFEAPITLRGAKGRSIDLESSYIKGGISGYGLRLEGSLFLRHVQVKGETRLSGARIKGDFDCGSGEFDNASGYALSCGGAEIGGNVYLDEGFTAKGETHLPGVQITGDLNCCEGNFDSTRKSGKALSCEHAKIGGALKFHNVNSKLGWDSTLGTFSFAHAEVGTLADRSDSWPSGRLQLDGFRYQRIDAKSPVAANLRVDDWLGHQEKEFLTGEAFALQPWTHLAKVLREQGHFRDAAEIDICREDCLRTAGRIVDRSSPKEWLGAWATIDTRGHYVSSILCIGECITLALHRLYGLFSGYGHRPMRIVNLALIIWIGLALFYWSVEGDFEPSSRAIIHEFEGKCSDTLKTLPIRWTGCEALLRTYPRFSPFAYSLDLILPVARLGQSTKWAPISDGSWFSFSGWNQRFVWFEEIFGWVAALTLGAIASGLVKRRDG